MEIYLKAKSRVDINVMYILLAYWISIQYHFYVHSVSLFRFIFLFPLFINFIAFETVAISLLSTNLYIQYIHFAN